MIITPHISEKAYISSVKNIYVFNVPLDAVKAEIERELVKTYKDIKIADIRTRITKGKVKASSRGKHARPGLAARKDQKVAYVTLKSGKIEIPEFKVEEPKADSKVKEPKAVKKVAEKAESKSASKIAARRTGNRGDK